MARVLIVENSSFMKGTLSTLLEYGGQHIVVGAAEDGLSAISFFKQRRPDLVMCDVLMGGLDGIPIIKTILKEDPAARIIAISVFGQEAKVNEAREIGASGVVYKPYKHSELMDEIQKVLKKS